jgi:hypothetical protein
VRLDDGKFGNFQRSAWRRLVPPPSTARANGAGLSKTAALLGDAFLRTPIEVQSFLSTRKESETEAILLLLGHMDHDCQSQNATT